MPGIYNVQCDILIVNLEHLSEAPTVVFIVNCIPTVGTAVVQPSEFLYVCLSCSCDQLGDGEQVPCPQLCGPAGVLRK